MSPYVSNDGGMLKRRGTLKLCSGQPHWTHVFPSQKGSSSTYFVCPFTAKLASSATDNLHAKLTQNVVKRQANWSATHSDPDLMAIAIKELTHPQFPNSQKCFLLLAKYFHYLIECLESLSFCFLLLECSFLPLISYPQLLCVKFKSFGILHSGVKMEFTGQSWNCLFCGVKISFLLFLLSFK